jgi:hypothetical protein
LLDVPVLVPVAVPDELLLALADLEGVPDELEERDALADLVELKVAVAERLRAGDRVDVTEEDAVLEPLDVPDDVLDPVVVLELLGLVVPVLDVEGVLEVAADLVLVRVEEPDLVEKLEADADKEGLDVIEDDRDPTDVFVAAALRVDVRVAVAVKEPNNVISAKSRPCSVVSYK